MSRPGRYGFRIAQPDVDGQATASVNRSIAMRGNATTTTEFPMIRTRSGGTIPVTDISFVAFIALMVANHYMAFIHPKPHWRLT